MKRHIIILLIFSVFAGASAQSYTQAFDSVFQHVDLSHTSTGILYERVLPLSNLVSYVTDIPSSCGHLRFLSVRYGLRRALLRGGAKHLFD